MKSNVEIYTMYLVNAIYDSREYREFEAIKKTLKDNPELKSKIDQYRIRNYQLQNFSNEEDLLEKTEKADQESLSLRENPLVDEYLSCELAVCRMLQKIASTVVGAVDLELELNDAELGLIYRGVKES